MLRGVPPAFISRTADVRSHDVVVACATDGGGAMIQELARPTAITRVVHDELGEDRAGLFRGVLLAVGLSVPLWGAVIWGLSKIG